MGWRIGVTSTLVLALFWVVANINLTSAMTETERPVVPVIADDGLCATKTNLLQNPSFEGEYSKYVPPGGHPDCPLGICNSVRTAASWTPWWTLHNNSDPEYIIKQPEFTAAEADFWYGPERTRSGSHAQQYFTLYATHEAGVYQQVATQIGGAYCFSVWGHSWSAADDPDPLNNAGDALSGPDYGQLWQKVGIDPTGGTDWTSPNIIWSDQETSVKGRHQYDVHALFIVTATAQADTATVFLYSQPDFAVKHNNVYWDDATFSLLSLPSIDVSTNSSLALITTITDTLRVTQTATLAINSPHESVTWTAALASGNTLTPVFTTNGGQTDHMEIVVDTAGLALGSYTADIVITTTPELLGSPFTIPIRVFIVAEVHDAFLPHIAR